jgi:hypothetical protein
MAPKPCKEARAALAKAKAAATAKDTKARASDAAKSVSKAANAVSKGTKAVAKATQSKAIAKRVDPTAVPHILLLLQQYGWLAASRVRNGRSIEQMAAFLFQNCDGQQTIDWVGILWYRLPTHLMMAVKERWDFYMIACQRATKQGIGHHDVCSKKMGVSLRGAVMGFA